MMTTEIFKNIFVHLKTSSRDWNFCFRFSTKSFSSFFLLLLFFLYSALYRVLTLLIFVFLCACFYTRFCFKVS